MVHIYKRFGYLFQLLQKILFGLYLLVYESLNPVFCQTI